MRVLTIALLQNKRMNTHLFSSINNINKPACVTCKYYKPEQYSNFDSIYSKCSLYGNKNLHTGEIEYSYATECRKNETICGQEGKQYEEKKFIYIVKLLHHFSNYSIISSVCILYIVVVYLATK